MKLSKTEVTSFLDDVLTQLRANHEKQEKANLERYDREFAEWKRRYADKWKAMAAAISVALRRGEPITAEMVSLRGSYDAVIGKRPTSSPFQEPSDIVVARRYLKAVVGDVVTDSPIFRDLYSLYTPTHQPARRRR